MGSSIIKKKNKKFLKFQNKNDTITIGENKLEK